MKHDAQECRRIFASLSEYLDQELDPGLCETLEGHLEGCPPCQAFLDALRVTVDLLHEAPSASLPEATRREILENYASLRGGPEPQT